MLSKESIKAWNMCAKKRSYDSQANALNSKAARIIPNARAYKCPNCSGWHLTKKETQNGHN